MNIDMTGEKYGRLTVIKRVKGGWLCKCDCGGERVVKGYDFRRHHYKSCGCITGNTRHGLRYTRVYEVWKAIKARCYNPHDKFYKNYGGKGIKVCIEWLNDPKAFHDWAVENGYKKGLSIDRINVNGDYEPANCRWASMREQANNKTSTVRVLYKGKLYTLYELEKLSGISRNNLYQRLFVYKWDIERALSQKQKKRTIRKECM